MSTNFGDRDRQALDLSGKVVVIVGGGQMPGPGLGNGRATAILAARHGAGAGRRALVRAGAVRAVRDDRP